MLCINAIWNIYWNKFKGKRDVIRIYDRSQCHFAYLISQSNPALSVDMMDVALEALDMFRLDPSSNIKRKEKALSCNLGSSARLVPNPDGPYLKEIIKKVHLTFVQPSHIHQSTYAHMGMGVSGRSGIGLIFTKYGWYFIGGSEGQ